MFHLYISFLYKNSIFHKPSDVPLDLPEHTTNKHIVERVEFIKFRGVFSKVDFLGETTLNI